MTTEQQKKNRQKARRARREAGRVPGTGAGKPIPIRQAGEPAVRSLADLAKAGGGQVPLSIPQLMAQVGSLKVERDFWMNAAVNLEAQVNGGGMTGIPTPAEIEAAEEEDDGEIPEISVIVTECPSCAVTLGPEATHAEGCQFQEQAFDPEDEPPEEGGGKVGEDEYPPAVGAGGPAHIGANVPPSEAVSELTDEEQAVLAEAARITALQDEAKAGEPQGGDTLPPPAPPTVEQAEGSEEPASE